MPRKAVILARVSSTQQEDGLSLDAQVRRLKEYAQRKDFEVVKEFVFTESAGDKIRTKFEEMLSYVKQNSDVKVVLAQNVDRVTRNFRDAVDLDEMRKRDNLEIHFVQDGFFINKDATGNQLFQWEAKVFLAKQYLNRLSDDVKRSVEQKMLNNEWYGKAPIGYTNITLDNDKKWITPNPKTAPLIKKMFKWYADEDCSMEMLRERTKKEGLTQGVNVKNELSKGQIDKILKNPFYYGEMNCKGKLVPHKYEPLISKELFQKTQDKKLSYKKKHFKFRAIKFIFRNLSFTCGDPDCGCAISFQKKVKHYPKTKRTVSYIYGRCTNYFKKHKKVTWVREQDLITQMIEYLKGMTIPDDVLSYLKKRLNESHEDKKIYHEQIMSNLKTEHEKLQTRLATLYEDRLDGRIKVEEYDTMVKGYKLRQAEILKQMGLHDKADESYYIEAGKLLDVASRAWDIFRSFQVEEKQEFLKFVLEDLTLSGKFLKINLRKPFNFIWDYAGRQQWLPLVKEVRTCIIQEKPYIFKKVA